MKITRKEIQALEIALSNYKSMWAESKVHSGVPSNSVYVDMNIAEFDAILNKMKRESM
jgi:hypothetical protein